MESQLRYLRRLPTDYIVASEMCLALSFILQIPRKRAVYGAATEFALRAAYSRINLKDGADGRLVCMGIFYVV